SLHGYLRLHETPNLGVHQTGSSSGSSSRSRLVLHSSLNFMIAWSFLFPLFSNTHIALHLRRNSPDLIAEMKDAFILLVINGPFPEACCGRG
uniref:hypothetical protein n=1 Tax=Klebsiella michiganensis TaxID=1134687 RepID=UPI00195358B5